MLFILDSNVEVGIVLLNCARAGCILRQRKLWTFSVSGIKSLVTQF